MQRSNVFLCLFVPLCSGSCGLQRNARHVRRSYRMTAHPLCTGTGAYMKDNPSLIHARELHCMRLCETLLHALQGPAYTEIARSQNSIPRGFSIMQFYNVFLSTETVRKARHPLSVHVMCIWWPSLPRLQTVRINHHTPAREWPNHFSDIDCMESQRWSITHECIYK